MQFLDPRNDVAFKKIFGSEAHKRVTISFLNSILEFTGDRAITDVEFMNTEQKRILHDKKDNVLDILCRDQRGNKIIIQLKKFDEGEFEEACHIAQRMTWSEEQLDEYNDAFVRETDQEGALEIAIEEKMQEIARNLLNKGMSVADIASMTSLSVADVEELKKKL